MFFHQHHHINQRSLLTRLEQPVSLLKSKPFVSFISPTSMALILAACRDRGSLSISGGARSVSFDGQAVIGSTGDDVDLEGTPLRDYIIDHEGVNIIDAHAGNDYILARGTVNAGDGNDIVKADGDADTLNGGDGNDVLVAKAGTVNGGDGHDYIQISFNDNFAINYEQQAEVRRGNFNGRSSLILSLIKTLWAEQVRAQAQQMAVKAMILFPLQAFLITQR